MSEGIIDHTGIFTDSVLNVPFLVFNPPKDFRPKFVSHLDIPDIITQIAKNDIPEIDREWAPSETIGAMGTPDQDKQWWNRTSRSLWKPSQKYIWDTKSDRSPPDFADTYFETPINLYDKKSNHSFDDATRAQLKSLGYL